MELVETGYKPFALLLMQEFAQQEEVCPHRNIETFSSVIIDFIVLHPYYMFLCLTLDMQIFGRYRPTLIEP